jgi:hypothetical protein
MKYYDLFDADCPAMPNDAQLPVVLVNGETTINGGKISIPAIRRKIESPARNRKPRETQGSLSMHRQFLPHTDFSQLPFAGKFRPKSFT